ncbi:YtzH-like family protein [Cytobacillus spongiae]|uniref:YtzH-like family protein n=1 Tax=Cytobacillus spongiae TaxID=2901381 RepID=UPI001F3E9194|nr:YtzH-like family protein [Cytobacillus spongiae]UII55240.1 YtzH-like family protein [Cytobacillus spongiae]
MPISNQDQLNLLTDILNNHQSDCCGSVSECEQLERLVKSLIANSRINNNVKTILEQVYSYSQDGINSSNLDQHIETNQHSLSNWVEEINQYS